MTDKVLLSFAYISVLIIQKNALRVDEKIYEILKIQSDFALEVWFSKYIIVRFFTKKFCSLKRIRFLLSTLSKQQFELKREI